MQMQPLKGRRVFYPLVDTEAGPVLNIYLRLLYYQAIFMIFIFMIFNFKQFLL